MGRPVRIMRLRLVGRVRLRALAGSRVATVTLLVRAEHLWQRRDTPEARRLFRYAMVSVVSTAVSFGILGVVFGALHLWGEVASTFVANTVATVPAYYLNRRWVWGKSGRSHLMKEMVPFWAMSALGIVVSIGGAAVARHIGIQHDLSHRQQTVIVLAANLVSFGVFYVLKYLVFNRLFQTHMLEDLDRLVEERVADGPVPVPELVYDHRSASWRIDVPVPAPSLP